MGEQMSNYYTYAYLRENGTPYYIGKGTGRRAYLRHSVAVPPRDRILFLKKNLSEIEAHNHEIYMIFLFGRKDIGTGILRNRTEGGEGTSGRKLSKETKQKMSKSAKGKKQSAETKKKLSEAISGFKWYTNGKETIQSFEHPGVEWVEGRVCTWESPTNSGMKWYNRDGVRKMFLEDPGDGWIAGLVDVNRQNNPTNRGKSWYNNGKINRMFIEKPSGEWIPGMIRVK